ncbi:GNAT family N-acetyltransferase [Amycolatopsis acididurans]|nr:GNAT family N-acetyltransferase [Amycolatopsis acididurans]
MEPKVVRNDEQGRYELWADEELAGIAEYRTQGERIVFTHTEVGEAFGGRGFGRVIAAGALDDAVERGLTIVPECPFIAAYLKKHPEYAEHVHWPPEARQ